MAHLGFVSVLSGGRGVRWHLAWDPRTIFPLLDAALQAPEARKYV